jgi:cytosine/adenosine deaminase-related metal-dependent hydrolase
MINAHTHLYARLAPPFTPGAFLDNLKNHWWVFDRELDERSLRAAARLYVAEAIELGTTMLVDHHESPNFIEGSLDVLADACEELGMRALLCYGATERNGGADEARRGLAECRRFIESNTRPLVRGAVGLHAAFTVSDATIKAAGELARELGVPIHVHVAEDVCDRDGFRRLRDALVPGSILAHCVHLTWDEVRACEKMRLWIVQNPRSNRANGVGEPMNLAASSRVALGTDGFPSEMTAEGTSEEIVRRREAGKELEREIFGNVTHEGAGDRRRGADGCPAEARASDRGRSLRQDTTCALPPAPCPLVKGIA